MSTLDRNEILTQQMTRFFLQPDGVGTQPIMIGLNGQYGNIDGASKQSAIGSIDPIYAPDPRRVKKYRLIGTQSSPSELPTVSLTFHEKMGGIPRQLTMQECEFNIYELHGRCRDLSDFTRGWSGYINVYSGFKVAGAVDLGTRTSSEGDEALTDTVEATGDVIYPVGEMDFGEEASTTIVADVLDAVYGTQISCKDCGISNNGSKLIYAITRANVASPSAPSQLVYSTDGGTTWSTATITGIGTTAEPRFIGVVNNILFVGTDGTSLFYTVLNPDTGVPTTWQSVTLPTDMHDVWVETPSSIWFVGGTSVYKTTDITIPPAAVDSGAPANLRRIHGGDNGIIVAVGVTGAVRFSRNRGVTWVTGVAPSASNLAAIQVIDDRLWYVGSADGNVYKTVDFSASWTTVSFPGAGTGAVKDIVAATREVIWVAYVASSVAYIATSFDGGYTWANSNSDSPRILNWPTFSNIHRLAVPTSAYEDVAANNLLVAGTAVGGADGILLNASALVV